MEKQLANLNSSFRTWWVLSFCWDRTHWDAGPSGHTRWEGGVPVNLGEIIYVLSIYERERQSVQKQGEQLREKQTPC